MIMTSAGQQRNETARAIYQVARKIVDGQIHSGKLPLAEADAAWAARVADRFAELGLKLPKKVSQLLPQAAETSSSTASPIVTEGVKAMGKASAAQAAKATLRAGAPIAALAFAIEAGVVCHKLTKGEIDKNEAKFQIIESGSSCGAGLAGATAGAAVGSVIPGIGTAIGAVIGGLVGSLAARKATRALLR